MKVLLSEAPGARLASGPPTTTDEMIDAFTRTHRESIDETMRAMFFADAVPVPDASPLDQLVAFLGRRPSATAPVSTTHAAAG